MLTRIRGGAALKRKPAQESQDQNEAGVNGQQLKQQQLNTQMSQQPTVQGKFKKPRGPTFLSEMWAVSNTTKEPIPIDFNSRGQPIGPNKKKLVGFLGTLSRNSMYTPLDFEDWRKVPDVRKIEMLKLVENIFDVPPSSSHYILKSIGKKRRHWKSRVKCETFDRELPVDSQVQNRPARVDHKQWLSLLSYWTREDVKAKSELNKKHSESSVMHPNLGRVSYAEIEESLIAELGRPPTRDEMFQVGFSDADGNPSSNLVSRKMDQMEEVRSQMPPGSEVSIGPEDCFAKVMGKDPRGKVRMFGLGVTPSDVWGSIPSRSTSHRMVLQHESTITKMAEQLAAATKIIAEFSEKMQQQTNSNNDRTTSTSKNGQTGHASTSSKSSNSTQVGTVVFLKSMIDEGLIVAKGTLLSLDPNRDVGGKTLGRNWCEVHINVPIVWEEELIRPHSNLTTVGLAIGTSIAWPRHLVANAEDQ